MSNQVATYDYIVVGSGSAGAIVAARLTENPSTKVLLLEAGPDDRSIWTKIPLGFAKMLFDPRYMWHHDSEPEPYLLDRRIPVPHGKVIGGSSTINGLIYVRGFPLDYALWQSMGAQGWTYDDVLPYFKKAERYRNGANSYHGDSGPIGVESAGWKNPLADAFIGAAEAIGIPRNDDLAGFSAEGIGYYDLTTWHGRRSSTGQEYLKPNRGRQNLNVVTEAFVTKVEFEGRRASGVVYERGGQIIHARANSEIVLSAGALQSPQILQLSGVGPAELLRRHGIPVVHELKGVGENLMDHVAVGRTYSTTSQFTFNAALRTPILRALAGLNYYVGARNGPMTIGAGLAGGFVSTRSGLEAPDVQLSIGPFLPDEKEMWKLAKESGFRLAGYQLRPESRGYVRIVSSDPKVSPAILFNYLSTENDLKIAVAGMELMQRIGTAEPLKKLGVTEIKPGADGVTGDQLIDYLRQTGGTAFHYCGTARIGTDELAVVDPKLRVRGIDKLRVIDASVMPTVVSGNTNAATLMIGEKGSDLLRTAG